MKLRFKKIYIRQGLWDQWEAPPYKIVSYAVGEYYAYYHNHHVCNPPSWVECQGCGEADCTGRHRAWASLAHAQEDCEDHNDMMENKDETHG